MYYDEFFDVILYIIFYIIICIFEVIEIVGDVVCQEKLTIVAQKSDLELYLVQHKIKYKMSKGIIRYLLKHNLLTGFNDDDEETITISYYQKVLASTNMRIKRKS